MRTPYRCTGGARAGWSTTGRGLRRPARLPSSTPGVEFTRAYPHAYRPRRTVVDRTVKRLDPALPDVPYATTGVPLGDPFLAHTGAERPR